jgi:glycerol-3-phosphate acyltransferase PlsX
MTEQPVTIALDGMGGDNAPRAPVEAAARLSRETNVRVLLVGRQDTLKAELDRFEHRADRIELRHASQTIGMADKPRQALDERPDASVAVACRAVAEGAADGVVSAGSTGALVLAAARSMPLVEGVKRAALAAVYPTRERRSSNDRFALLLDVGANVRCSAEHLVQFAYMGHAYASCISRVDNPSIGLLNLGAEETKGDETLTTAHRLMREAPGLHFIGNVEGNDLPRGVADVIVCEGFIGNVVLKMAEGMVETMKNLGQHAFKSKLAWRLGLMLLHSGLKQVKALTDYSEYGGAPFLGFSHMVIKAHGRSGSRAIANAVKVSAKAVRGGVPASIREGVARLGSLQSPSSGSGSDPKPDA